MRMLKPLLMFLPAILLLSCNQDELIPSLSNSQLQKRLVLPRQAQTWDLKESMNTARSRHTATLLPDGTVLVAGGITGTLTTITATTSVEIYYPNSETWSIGADMHTPRSRHTATLLQDGRVLVVGGRNLNGSTSAVELYDVNTGTWIPAASMHVPRDYHTATLLNDGRVLVTGGLSGGDGFANPVEKTAEIFDPLTGQWVIADHMAIARWGHSATLLNNGNILVAGGTSPAGDGVYTVRAEVYDPNTDIWKNVDGMKTPRGFHAAILLEDSDVLVAGGFTLPPNVPQRTATAEIFQSDTQSWSETGSLQIPRSVIQTSTVRLLNGHVLVAGSPGVTSEVYNPVSGLWNMSGSMNTGRSNHTLTLLETGDVLATGGENRNGFISSAEVYVYWD